MACGSSVYLGIYWRSSWKLLKKWKSLLGSGVWIDWILPHVSFTNGRRIQEVVLTGNSFWCLVLWRRVFAPLWFAAGFCFFPSCSCGVVLCVPYCVGDVFCCWLLSFCYCYCSFWFLFFVSFVCLATCGVVFLCASLVLIKVCYFKNKIKLSSAKEW
jgi:hypothetical protein